MFDLSGRKALVTGASGGIGEEIARLLHKQGAIVGLHGTRVEKLEALANELGDRVKIFPANLSDRDEVKALGQKAEADLEGVDILVNNAGIMKLSPIAQTDDASFDAQIAVNLGGVFRGMREGAKRLRDGGRIVNFSSSVVGLYQPGYGVYAATKAAVEAMTHILAKELGARRITVNAVAPGPVETALFMDGKSAAQVEATAKMIPLGRLGQPDDIAGVVSFLAGPDSGWVNGQIIRANGGVI